MSGISLTASMRSNLLSLQNISGQVSSTQNKLSTGNKVNSAIDNPSSYYTALSLNNRADDLNALLDSMGQAVSTIKAATTALESATEFLEQAKAVANQALETAKVPDKAFFEEKVGENGAVVTTAQELRDAVNSGKETICVYGAIDLGDISTSGGLNLKENQKLVGVGYFGNYDTDTNKFSSITATTVASQSILGLTQQGNVLSDLSLNYTSSATSSAISINGGTTAGKQHQIILQNLDIKMACSDQSSTVKTAIFAFNNSVINLQGTINIDTSGAYTYGFYAYNGTTTNIVSGTKLGVTTSGQNGHGLGSYYSTINIFSGSTINLNTTGTSANGILNHGGICNINQGADVSLCTSGYNTFGLFSNGGECNVSGNLMLNILSNNGLCSGLYINNSGGGKFNILSSATIYFATANSNLAKQGGNATNILSISQGAKLAFEENGKTNWYQLSENYLNKDDANAVSISADNVENQLNVEETTAWKLPEEIREDSKEETAQDFGSNGKQYQEIINQYDSLIKDASYKGINLLQPERLTVKFNEDNTAALEVQGRDMSSKALGFTIFEWQTQGDINKSIEELSSAINAIRNYSSELGNNYNIITTRQDFTESLVNVLTEGADKLTLADMNEESANMLALQTRQQLAINSLSLASQASQSILKLF